MSDLEEFPENDPIFFYHQRLVHASQILWVLLWVSKSSFFDNILNKIISKIVGNPLKMPNIGKNKKESNTISKIYQGSWKHLR